MILNPDKEYVSNLQETIKRNFGYCPCVLIKTQDTICPCLSFRERDICHCHLYIQEEID